MPARLAETLQGYVEQMRVTLRPGSMPHIERTLREFALWLRAQAPEVTAVRDLRRAHIERYKRHVAQKPNLRGGRLSKRTIAGDSRRCGSAWSGWPSGTARTHPRAH